VFGGSLNATKIAAYVMVCLGLCDRACGTKRTATWSPKSRTAAAASRKQGQWEAMRLMETLGWKKNGTATQPLRIIEGDGIPGLETLVKELNRLAKKYDAE
jgi:hypothetical protein